MSIEVEVGGIFEEAADLTPAGSIIAFGGTTAPSGWLLCNGNAVNRVTYRRLYDAIGISFGDGDGHTTFNLPDLQGIFIRGAGANSSMTKADGNAFDGGNLGVKKNDKMQQIKGDFTTWETVADPHGAYSFEISNIKTRPSAGGSTGRRMLFDSDNSTAQGGARTGDETAPSSLSLNYIIKI